jgi:hypothetical protein
MSEVGRNVGADELQNIEIVGAQVADKNWVFQTMMNNKNLSRKFDFWLFLCYN